MSAKELRERLILGVLAYRPDMNIEQVLLVAKDLESWVNGDDNFSPDSETKPQKGVSVMPAVTSITKGCPNKGKACFCTGACMGNGTDSNFIKGFIT
ncbi:hypothetical protein [Aquirhabdus parva]|uniref:Uncharacterized protein n=1 Tax=Aquirhabdus parva TaxID=2283318 RepID=A0A345PAU9_9GAMM|nr:hypothetical protein [Aquirhabdus parva]AXI04364.1 hypothetical protein HYN46_16890 [Aquirhabdus parva]AXI04408.1 hypothetical protein HYN46_17135 [Aquirhabdus parva]